MSQSFRRYLVQQLEDKLKKQRIVVFYDPRNEFTEFIDRFEQQEGTFGVPQICVGDTLTHLARYTGSYFTLKLDVEPIVSADLPSPIILYLPNVQRDLSTSVLMELELAGCCYEPQLRRLARNELRTRFTDGDIDEMLRAERLSIDDVERYLAQEGSLSGSSLKVALDASSRDNSESMIAKWLADESWDPQIEEKLAQAELFRLLDARVGLKLDEGLSLTQSRSRAWKYLLINEFRDDLAGESLDRLEIISQPNTTEERSRINTIVSELRAEYGEKYITIADQIQDEFNLASARLDPSTLGKIDTFRFEEHHLLAYTAELIASSHYEKAKQVITERADSFWVDQPQFLLDRFAQWEACTILAELGALIAELTPKIKRYGSSASQWIQSYANLENGWFKADQLHRRLENWLANMQCELEEPIELALNHVRRNQEALLQVMATGFSEALESSSWSTPEILSQTHIYQDFVAQRSDKIAYFFVDAMRYEMGVELMDRLEGAQELQIIPAMGVLPSITPLGMGALLPEASSGYSVVDHNDNLATQIGEHVLPELKKRQKYLKSVRPDSADIDLGSLLQTPNNKLEKKLRTDEINLLVVRSQEIDLLGEMDGGFLARQTMDTVIGNVARAVKKLTQLGFNDFVITSDHGHQFSLRKDEDMIMDKPGGTTVDQHRRCWAGHGGHTTSATMRVGGAQLGYQTDLDFIFPKGIAVFRCGGDLAFHHGGCSLQEVVIPVLSVRMNADVNVSASSNSQVVSLEQYPSTLTNRTFGLTLKYEGKGLFDAETIEVRVALISDGQEVGRAGMALNADFDRQTSTITLPFGQAISVGMMLTQDQCQNCRVILSNPQNETIIAQSELITIGSLL